MTSSAAALEQIVQRIMIDEFEVDEAALRPEARLRDDLGLDSLDGVDLVVALEKAFRCRIPEEEARSIRTLGDIYARIRQRAPQAVGGTAS
jgi:acyl carrier protein